MVANGECGVNFSDQVGVTTFGLEKEPFGLFVVLLEM